MTTPTTPPIDLTKVAARVDGLKVHFPLRGKGFFNFGEKPILKAVDGVNLEVRQGEILGLVGESGCGKSTLGRAIIRLNKPVAGKIEINGVDFLALKGRKLNQYRPNVQMIFQDPYASLDPRMTVYDILAEGVRTHMKMSKAALNTRIHDYLELCGLPFAASKKYPHEFSGGQRQRIAIARALILEPKIIIADEPVSALDVSIQAQILNLLKDIQKRLGLSMIFISHNLAVVRYISDRIAVMYLGKIVEIADRDELYRNPLHPYTKALISAVPIPDPKLEKARAHTQVRGELPSPINPPKGCTFHTRCPIAFDRCKVEIPQLKGYRNNTQFASCFDVDQNPPQN